MRVIYIIVINVVDCILTAVSIFPTILFIKSILILTNTLIDINVVII
jgi:hypothetical protein